MRGRTSIADHDGGWIGLARLRGWSLKLSGNIKGEEDDVSSDFAGDGLWRKSAFQTCQPSLPPIPKVQSKEYKEGANGDLRNERRCSCTMEMYMHS